MMIDALYADLVDAKALENMRKAMVIAAEGQTYREGGKDGDDLYSSYTNVSSGETALTLAVLHEDSLHGVCWQHGQAK